MKIFSWYMWYAYPMVLCVVGLIEHTAATLESACGNSHSQLAYSWAVIGAGPAGIISVGQLLEHGVSDYEILWIDPEFSPGRMGKYYGKVPSNQKA